jgi:hypothetical protein
LTVCPLCGVDVVPGQEYCVECGVRLPGRGPVASTPDPGGGWIARAALALVIAVVGAVAAVAAAGGGSGGTGLITATGGFATVPTTGTAASPGELNPGRIVDWPAGETGWTIALASLPQTGGRQAALTEARKARSGGLTPVGILDSSEYASLHPGYWVVFTGVYTSEAEATSALQPARAFSRSATVRRVVP